MGSIVKWISKTITIIKKQWCTNIAKKRKSLAKPQWLNNHIQEIGGVNIVGVT